MTNSYYLYYLRRPDLEDQFELGMGQPFYVGKGKKGRVYAHRKSALKHKDKIRSHRTQIIHKLWSMGLDFIEEVIMSNLSNAEAVEIEKEAILAYGRIDLGTGCLTNCTIGGGGVNRGWKKEARLRVMGENNSNGMQGKHHNDVSKKTISDKNKYENLSSEEIKERADKRFWNKLNSKRGPQEDPNTKLYLESKQYQKKKRHSTIPPNLTEEQRKEKYGWAKGIKYSEERVQQMRDAMTEEIKEYNRRINKELMTEEKKEQLRENSLKWYKDHGSEYWTEERRKEVSESMKGHNVTPESIKKRMETLKLKKINGWVSPLKNRPRTEEHRKKIREGWELKLISKFSREEVIDILHKAEGRTTKASIGFDTLKTLIRIYDINLKEMKKLYPIERPLRGSHTEEWKLEHRKKMKERNYVSSRKDTLMPEEQKLKISISMKKSL